MKNLNNGNRLFPIACAIGIILILLVFPSIMPGCSGSADVGELQKQIEMLKAENDSLKAVVDSLKDRAYSPGLRLQPPGRHEGLGVR